MAELQELLSKLSLQLLCLSSDLNECKRDCKLKPVIHSVALNTKNVLKTIFIVGYTHSIINLLY